MLLSFVAILRRKEGRIMSAETVRAELTIAPFNRDELVKSDSGKKLLAIIDNWGFDDLFELDEDDIP
jgi:hypothetical protein